MRAKTILTVLFLISVAVAAIVVLRAMPTQVDANQADMHEAPFPGPHWSYHRAVRTADALADYAVEWLEEPLDRAAPIFSRQWDIRVINHALCVLSRVIEKISSPGLRIQTSGLS